KGYDAEIVVIAGVDCFVANDVGILTNTLYVAMTRSRSILALYGQTQQAGEPARLLSVIEDCLDQIVELPEVEADISKIDEFEDVLARLGCKREWLERLWRTHEIQLEPIHAADGEELAAPLFWYKDREQVHACFEPGKLSKRIQHRME